MGYNREQRWVEMKGKAKTDQPRHTLAGRSEFDSRQLPSALSFHKSFQSLQVKRKGFLTSILIEQ